MNYIGCPMEIAEKYGLEGGVILQNLYFWISKNKANGKHFHDGRYWTYNSMNAFVEQFKIWNKKQIMRILNNLKKAGAIHVGNYNKSPYDRTNWYALDESVLKIFDPNFINEVKSEEESHELQVEEESRDSKENTQKSPWLSIVPNGTIDDQKRDFGNSKMGPPIPDKYQIINNNNNKLNNYNHFRRKVKKNFSNFLNNSCRKTSYNLDELLSRSGLYIPE